MAMKNVTWGLTYFDQFTLLLEHTVVAAGLPSLSVRTYYLLLTQYESSISSEINVLKH